MAQIMKQGLLKKLLDVSINPAYKRGISTSCVRCAFLDARDPKAEMKSNQIILHEGDAFKKAAQKARDKETFHGAINAYLFKNEKYRRGSVEFIYAAMNYMEEFDVHKDLDTYKKLLSVMQKHVMVSKTVWQAEMQHFPKQQQCIIDLMEQMGNNGVIPDDDFGYMLKDRFGTKPHVFRKYQRMMYWMPKFRNANPYPVPYHLPNDDIELAKIALKRMSFDIQHRLSTFKTAELEDASEDTFIVSSSSPAQEELISKLPPHEPIFVEGAHRVWLREKSLTYFVLKANPQKQPKTKKQLKEEEEDEVGGIFKWKIFGSDYDESEVIAAPTVHEQDDGVILGMCITGTSSINSLRMWITFLQKSNSVLGKTPVLFKVHLPEEGLQVYEDQQQKHYDRQASS